jgi:tRNA threonylcarbamoyladenosine biosynthesis protein TsaE
MPLPDLPSDVSAHVSPEVSTEVSLNSLPSTHRVGDVAELPSACGEPLRRCALSLADEAATDAFAARLAAALAPGLVVWLCGTLGAGKTTLVRGLLRALGHAGPVRSPTFTLLEPYAFARFAVYHFDLYRFASAHEWHDAGFDDYFGKTGVCLVEWPEQAAGAVPAPDVRIALAFSGEPGATSQRSMTLEAWTQAGLRCVNAIVDGC